MTTRGRPRHLRPVEAIPPHENVGALLAEGVARLREALALFVAAHDESRRYAGQIERGEPLEHRAFGAIVPFPLRPRPSGDAA